jgi:cysteinyl-tRNA synthetase
MSLRYLGPTIDIHGGGEDLIFPHHENEIAQTEAFTGKTPFVRYWLHNAWVKMGEEKMSKSLGNFITIRDGLNKVGGDGLRLWVLTSHYRKPLTFSEDTLESAKHGADRIRTAARAAVNGAGDGGADLVQFRERFIAAMDDDLNTPQALAVLFDLAKAVNRAHDEDRPAGDARALLLELAGVLGLRLEMAERALDSAPFVAWLERLRAELAAAQLGDLEQRVRDLLADGASAATVQPRTIDAVVQLRTQLRSAKQWKLADGVRDGLATLGITLEDGPQGTVWKLE